MERSLHDCPPWGLKTSWRAANRTLVYLMRLHGPDLDRAGALARQVQGRLESIFPLLDDLCAVTCLWCPDPCCLMAKVWVDFQDLLFIHLGGHQIPQAQLLPDMKKTCRYSSPRGCTLPRVTRPWACTWYLCPTQMANFRQKTRRVQDKFNQDIQDIKIGREKMEAEFIRTVS